MVRQWHLYHGSRVYLFESDSFSFREHFEYIYSVSRKFAIFSVLCTFFSLALVLSRVRLSRREKIGIKNFVVRLYRSLFHGLLFDLYTYIYFRSPY